MKKKESLNISFKFQGIRTEQFAIFPDKYNAKKDTALGTKLDFKLNNIENQIGCYIHFDFEQGKNRFITIEVSCHYVVEESSFNKFKDEEKKKVIIPKDFLTHLAVLTVGTTRGILFSKTEGSIFSSFILPTINLTEMIDVDAMFEID